MTAIAQPYSLIPRVGVPDGPALLAPAAPGGRGGQSEGVRAMGV